MGDRHLIYYAATWSLREARKVEHGRPPTPSQRKKQEQQKSSYIHIPSLWNLESTVYSWGSPFWSPCVIAGGTLLFAGLRLHRLHLGPLVQLLASAVPSHVAQQGEVL